MQAEAGQTPQCTGTILGQQFYTPYSIEGAFLGSCFDSGTGDRRCVTNIMHQHVFI